MELKKLLYCGLVPALLAGCSYQLSFGSLQPVDSQHQSANINVLDNGTVIFTEGRLEVGVRVFTDRELNRQFEQYSRGGNKSSNPYTLGDFKPPDREETPGLFTVLLLSVKNYEFPKVIVDPLNIGVRSASGRMYEPFSLALLEQYYYPLAQGYAGNAFHNLFQQRVDILRQTLYKKEPVFSGQEESGFVVFPRLHEEVQQITIFVNNIVVRFDYAGRPTRTLNAVYRFEREVEKVKEWSLIGGNS